MKLRNKKTGEIKEVIVGGYPVSGKTKMWECSEMDANEETGYKTLGTYSSLAELNEEWEDYEEPKEYWVVDYITCGVDKLTVDPKDPEVDDFNKEIGNYFETKEEAEQAVEKLKAWKRLEDKGFRFILDGETGMPMFVYSGANGEKCITSAEESKQCRGDIKMLFGGED